MEQQTSILFNESAAITLLQENFQILSFFGKEKLIISKASSTNPFTIL